MNGTNGLTFNRYLFAAGTVITVLFTVLSPSASAGFGLVGRFVFWTLHTFGALAVLALAQGLVDRWAIWRRRPFVATAFAGLVGAWGFAPFALAFERGLGMVGEPDGDALDGLAVRWGVPGELVAEALELSLPVAVTWSIINLPWLLRLDFTPPGPGASSVGDGPPAVPSVEPEPVEPELPPVRAMDAATTDTLDESSTVSPVAEPAPGESDSGLLSELPAALGRDIVALSSQLHYLEVHTDRGRMLVLYNLRDAVRDLAGRVEGLQIHRSHWVADRHVRRLRKRGSGWVCELSGGLELPVSRRRVGEAKARWGAAATYGGA